MTSDNASNLAKEAKILDLFDGYPSASPTAENLRQYLDAVSSLSVEAVSRSVGQFRSGLVERENRAFAPSADEFAHNARAWESALGRVADAQAVVDAQALVSYPIGEKPPEGFVPLGPVSVDFGKGTIDLSGKTHAEKEAILASGGQEPIDAARHAELPEAVRAAIAGKARAM